MSVLSDEDNSSYARYQALEQRDRGIIRHLLLSVSAGAAAGVLGTLIHVSGLGPIERIYDPYAYFLLTVIVGRTAAGFGWAVLSSMLAALAPMRFVAFRPIAATAPRPMTRRLAYRHGRARCGDAVTTITTSNAGASPSSTSSGLT